MGGGAFKHAAAEGHPTLNTPRMSPTEYAHLKGIYLTKIRAYFADPRLRTAALKEAPEKLDYGDIDLFIGMDKEVDFLKLANALGAAGLITHSTGDVQKCTIGVPKDGTTTSSPTIHYHTVHSDDDRKSASPAGSTPEEYAQIDIDVIPVDLVEWHVFYSAYGDLNGLLGHIVTNLGFTVTDQGLWLRMKELDAAKMIERANLADQQGRILLSKDPGQVMRFMGLSVSRWDTGFATLDELYEWLGECRMLHSVALKLRRDKAHERNRGQKRDVYRRFFFEWLPARMPEISETFEETEQKEKIANLRQKYLNDAVDFFNKRAIYDEMHHSMVLAINNAVAANLLRPLIVKHSNAKAKKLGELVRAFRRFVEFDEDVAPYVARTAHADAESQLHRWLDRDAAGFEDAAAVDDFVRINWQKLKEVERLRAKKKDTMQGDAPEAKEEIIGCEGGEDQGREHEECYRRRGE